MRQYGLPTLLKTAAITAIVTSGLWVSAGMVWYYRSGPGQGVVTGSGGETAAVAQSPAGSPIDQHAVLTKASAMTPAPPVAPVVPGRLILPVVGIQPRALADTFTQSRSGGRVHDAIDIMAPRGTPVVAAAAGQVEKLFWSDLGGITAYVRSADRRLIYYYAHLDSYAPGLAEGQQLAAGAAIGKVGFTGNADPAGPHLHFAIMATTPDRKWYQPATAINPYPFLMRGAR